MTLGGIRLRRVGAGAVAGRVLAATGQLSDVAAAASGPAAIAAAAAARGRAQATIVMVSPATIRSGSTMPGLAASSSGRLTE